MEAVLIQTNATHHAFHASSASEQWRSHLTSAHGILFIIAWFFFVPVAVAGSRYFRDTLTSYTPMGLRLWYHTHRTFNIIAVALMIAGLICILIAEDWKWTGPKIGGKHNTSAYACHAMFGMFSTVLGWLQPLNSLLRCGPQHALRPIFNWVHRSIGVIAWLFAAAAIMIVCKHFTWAFMDAKVALGAGSTVIGIVGVTVLLCEVISVMKKRRQHLDMELDNHKLHWATLLHLTIVGLAAVALMVLVTILCLLIGIRK